jgi:hypothetical protein
VLVVTEDLVGRSRVDHGQGGTALADAAELFGQAASTLLPALTRESFPK